MFKYPNTPIRWKFISFFLLRDILGILFFVFFVNIVAESILPNFLSSRIPFLIVIILISLNILSLLWIKNYLGFNIEKSDSLSGKTTLWIMGALSVASLFLVLYPYPWIQHFVILLLGIGILFLFTEKLK